MSILPPEFNSTTSPRPGWGMADSPTAGTPAQWGTPQDHAACGDAIQAARALGARDALLALAAGFDRRAAETFTEATAHAARDDDGASLMASAASDAWRAAARTARGRARSCGSEAERGAPVSQEGQGRPADLSPAGAYMEGVKAERERVAQLSQTYNAMYAAACMREDCKNATHYVHFADLIREVPSDARPDPSTVPHSL